MRTEALLLGHVVEQLQTLDDESVHCCVTSPPYWGLRDYGTATWEGGDAECDHSKLMGGTGAQGLGKSDHASAANVERSSVPFRDTCGKCGATRIDAQLGLEPTPEAYVEKMVGVFREVRRVLRDDGTLWLNLGDSYCGGGRGGNPEESEYRKQATNVGSLMRVSQYQRALYDFVAPTAVPHGLKPKDLVGIPWRVAFALQADGWYLRSDIIWSKPNPMPESVTDRPTKAHEYVFLMSKSPRYYYDADAIAEDLQTPAHAPGNKKLDASRNDHDQMEKVCGASGTRNRRSVWTVATKPYRGAHFATFPPKLIEPCILAGCPKDGIVLDPFLGSGTTAAVAKSLGRGYIGIELNPEYMEMAKKRINETHDVLFAI